MQEVVNEPQLSGGTWLRWAPGQGDRQWIKGWEQRSFRIAVQAWPLYFLTQLYSLEFCPLGICYC